MENELLTLVASAIAVSWVTAGIVNPIKDALNLEGIQVIITAVLIGTLLLGSGAVIFGYPLAESLLMGVITGFASIGAFEGADKGKGFVEEATKESGGDNYE